MGRIRNSKKFVAGSGIIHPQQIDKLDIINRTYFQIFSFFPRAKDGRSLNSKGFRTRILADQHYGKPQDAEVKNTEIKQVPKVKVELEQQKDYC